MSKTSPVILIFDAGPNVSDHVARSFASKGYRVALAARTASDADNSSEQIHVATDLSDPSSVIKTFAEVKRLLGVSPIVVVYNAFRATPNDGKHPFSLPLEDFTRNYNVNIASAFIAAQQAVLGFEQLPESASRNFIYTGNLLNTTTMATHVDLGHGKTGAAHIIEIAAAAYKDRGYKFYYGDERTPDGGAAYMDSDGGEHGECYLELAVGKSQGPWLQTFVKAVGYKEFPLRGAAPFKG